MGASSGAALALFWDYDDIVIAEALGGSVTYALPLAAVSGFQLEVDGSLGAARYRDRNFISAATGVRAWREISHEHSLYAGVDANFSAYAEVGRQPRTGLPLQDLVVELRPMLAHQITEGVWIGARPGVASSTRQVVPILDVPVSLTVVVNGFRVGAEFAGQAALLYPVPSGVRTGVVVGYEF